MQWQRHTTQNKKGVTKGNGKSQHHHPETTVTVHAKKNKKAKLGPQDVKKPKTLSYKTKDNFW